MILPREPPRRQLGRGPIGMHEVFPSGKRKEGGHYRESRNRVSSPSGGQGLGAVSRLAHVPLVWGVWPERGSSLGGRWCLDCPPLPRAAGSQPQRLRSGPCHAGVGGPVGLLTCSGRQPWAEQLEAWGPAARRGGVGTGVCGPVGPRKGEALWLPWS